MTVDSQNIFIGSPDQLTTGAVQTADLGTTAPTSAREVLSTDSWNDSGYVDENGVTLSQNRSTTSIKDWSGANVRTLLDEFTGTVQYAEMETTYESACRMVGAAHVTKTEATAEHGTQLKIALGPQLPPARAWVFSMKDEDRRLRIYIPNGQVTAVENTSFVRNDAVKWNFTITANDDGTGHSIYILTDDGKIVTD